MNSGIPARTAATCRGLDPLPMLRAGSRSPNRPWPVAIPVAKPHQRHKAPADA